MRGLKLHNEYAAMLPWFHDAPKAVLAAIAVSYASQGGDYLDLAAERCAREWQLLHDQGIIPQRPPAVVRAAAKEEACELPSVR